MKYILPLLFCWFLIEPWVYCDPLYIVFHKGSHTDVDCVAGNPANAAPGDIWIPWEPKQGHSQAVQDYDFDRNHQLFEKQKPTPPPGVDPLKFKHDCLTDPIATPDLQHVQAVDAVALLLNDSQRQALWARLSPILSPAAVAQIEAHAKAANMPLK